MVRKNPLLQHLMKDLADARKERRKERQKERKESERARSKQLEERRRDREAEKKRREKYEAWAELLCLKHDIPTKYVQSIAREGMRLKANKSEMETVIVAKLFRQQRNEELRRKFQEAGRKAGQQLARELLAQAKKDRKQD